MHSSKGWLALLTERWKCHIECQMCSTLALGFVVLCGWNYCANNSLDILSSDLYFPPVSLCVCSLLMNLRSSSTRNAPTITWRPLTVTQTRRPFWAACVAVRFPNHSSPQTTRCTCVSSLMPQCNGKDSRPHTPLVHIVWYFDIDWTILDVIELSCWS